MVWTTVLPFISSIFTEDPILPEEVQVIRLVEPADHDSPPLGEVTVIEEGEIVVGTGVGVEVGTGVGVAVGVGVGVGTTPVVRACPESLFIISDDSSTASKSVRCIDENAA
jgi:hypothetical protein